ncbi:hypothetical protein ABES23_19470 [Peribacillus frigoritolerans]|jgi:hypothetical protein|uniref:Sigma-O factor regulatory protein RsoA n=1 Tax=Peribacillus simplex TaxID=1478 RepID=A0A9W4L4D6_9BACI|nr:MULTISPECIES: hypothetical protein [Peribacillus]MCK2020712.1 hypothetical protein [Peribacillus frigoritolerans]MCP1492088.1 hypothetical protein [Peribacillus frigoritolerans]MDR4928550.1 hypothetical protein [Peribacillus simplex]PCD05439.1 hypothetical protein CMV16_23670 [Peribacillus simplex]WHX91542.1 hypothetical protein QNH50_01055 [Peribacillus simplex]
MECRIKNQILEEKNIEELLDEFQLKIKKSLSNTSPQEREDLEQQVKMKIIEKLPHISNTSTGFWDFLKDV